MDEEGIEDEEDFDDDEDWESKRRIMQRSRSDDESAPCYSSLIPQGVMLDMLRILPLKLKKQCRLLNWHFRNLIDKNLVFRFFDCDSYSWDSQDIEERQTQRLRVNYDSSMEDDFQSLPSSIESLHLSAIKLVKTTLWSEHVTDLNLRFENHVFEGIPSIAFRNIRRLNIDFEPRSSKQMERPPERVDFNLKDAVQLEDLRLTFNSQSQSHQVLKSIPRPEKLKILNLNIQSNHGLSQTDVISRFFNLKELSLNNYPTNATFHKLEYLSLNHSLQMNAVAFKLNSS